MINIENYKPIIILLIKLALLGAFGSFIRAWIGIQKTIDNKNFKFDKIRLINSIITGMLCGICSGLLLGKTDPSLIISWGYVGIDGLEGLLKKR